MKLPQIILVGLYMMSLGLYLAKHGEPKKGTYSFFYALLSTSLQMLLLWWGGFFG